MIDEALELAAENGDRLMYTGIGIGTGFLASYTGRYLKQRKGLDHDYSKQDFHRRLIEEDPVTDLEDYRENKLMEFYYDKFGHVKQAYSDSKSSLVYTVAIDGTDMFLGENEMGLDEYPEGFAGVFIGLKLGRKVPAPVDVSEAYQDVREKFTD